MSRSQKKFSSINAFCSCQDLSDFLLYMVLEDFFIRTMIFLGLGRFYVKDFEGEAYFWISFWRFEDAVCASGEVSGLWLLL